MEKIRIPQNGDRRELPMVPKKRRKNHSIALLFEEIERLKGTVRELRACSEDLEAERQQLLRENRRLRREVTLSRLIEDLEDSIESVDEIGHDEPDATPPPAGRLYQELPDRFPFPNFFRIAEEAGLETKTARRCLVYFLTEDLLVQTGAQLEKPEQMDLDLSA